MLKWGKSHQLAGGGSLQPPDYFCSTSGCIRGRASKLLGGIRQLLAITHLEPDILECEVKWVLGSITITKLVEMMGFQLSYIKSYKMIL